MKIAISGSSSFIIKAFLLNYPIKSGQLRILSRKASNTLEDAEQFTADLGEKDSNLSGFFDEVGLFIHAAAEINNQQLMHKTNVLGTKALLDELLKSRNNRSFPVHWIQLSSCGAYGQNLENNQLARFIDESTPNNPNGEYECTKTDADEIIINFGRQHDWFNYTIIRPTIVFGQGMKSSLILRIAKLIKHGLFFYVGHKDAIINLVHVNDVAKVISLAALNENAYNNIFIISNDCRLEDFVNTIANSLQKNKPKLIINEYIVKTFVIIVNKLTKLPINQSQVDFLTRKNYYSNQKVINILNWFPDKNVLLQLEEYIHECIK